MLTRSASNNKSEQVRNYTIEMLKETFSVRFAVASDYDAEDADHLVTITVPAHYLKAMSIDLSKKGFEWHQYNGNDDVFRKYVKQPPGADAIRPVIHMLEQETQLYSNIYITETPK